MQRHFANILPCRKGQSGSALIMALLVLLVMSIVVMGMATDSDLDVKISRNLQLKNEAFNNAETGIDVAVSALRHLVVNKYSEAANNYKEVHYGSYVLTTPSGLDNIYHYGGNLTLKSDGEDVAHITVTSQEYNDEDRKWFNLFSTGFSMGNATETVSLVIKEIDTSMDINSPLSLLNDDPNLTLRGNTWVSHRNHEVPEDFYCQGSDCSNVSTFDDGWSEYAVFSVENLDLQVSGQLDNQVDGGMDNIVEGPTEFDQEYWLNRADYFKSIAEQNERIFVGEDPEDLGTRDNPMVTVLDGVNINNANGAGVLILRNGARITGNAHFEGLVICLLGQDEDAALFSGGTNTVFGGMIVLGDASDVELEDESSEDVEFAGNPYVKYSRQALLSAMMAVNNNAPLEKLSWKSE